MSADVVALASDGRSCHCDTRRRGTQTQLARGRAKASPSGILERGRPRAGGAAVPSPRPCAAPPSASSQPVCHQLGRAGSRSPDAGATAAAAPGRAGGRSLGVGRGHRPHCFSAWGHERQVSGWTGHRPGRPRRGRTAPAAKRGPRVAADGRRGPHRDGVLRRHRQPPVSSLFTHRALPITDLGRGVSPSLAGLGSGRVYSQGPAV